jgi:hypothetical protein
MATKKMTVVINDIRQTASRAGSTMPGNPIVNNNLWINAGELRNLMLGAGLTPDIPISALTGLEMTFEQLTITQEDIDKGIASGEFVERNGQTYKGYIHTVQGRKVAYAKPGVNNVNLQIDFSPLIKHFGLSEVVKTKLIVDKARREAAAEGEGTRVAAPRTPRREVTIEEPLETGTNGQPAEMTPVKTLTEQPKVLEGIKDDADGNKVNADGSPLSAEQQEALNAWVQAIQMADPIGS